MRGSAYISGALSFMERVEKLNITESLKMPSKIEMVTVITSDKGSEEFSNLKIYKVKIGAGMTVHIERVIKVI